MQSKEKTDQISIGKHKINKSHFPFTRAVNKKFPPHTMRAAVSQFNFELLIILLGNKIKKISKILENGGKIYCLMFAKSIFIFIHFIIGFTPSYQF